MHIVHVAHNYFPGIGLAAMYEYCLQEAEQGLQVSAVVLGRHDSGIVEENYKGVHLYKIPSRSISARSIKKIGFILQASKLLKTLNCDLVHVYSNVGLGFLPILVGKRDKKWIYDIRSGPVHPGLSRKIGLALLRLESLNFDLVAAVSSGTRNMVFPKSPEKVPIFNLGVNFERFKPMNALRIRQQYGIAAEKILLIFTGTLHPTRKLEVLIKAMASVKGEFGTSTVLMVVGDGPAYQNLVDLVRELGLTDVIIFTGPIHFDDIPGYLCAADVGLAFVPDTAEYGPQPALKTAEMLACELPVIATNTEGNRLFIRDGENGVLANDNSQDLANAILRMLRHEEELNKYRLAARASIQQYSYHRIVTDTLIPIYNQLLKPNPR